MGEVEEAWDKFKGKEEIPLVDGQPVGTVGGRWPNDAPPPVEDGRITQVEEKVPDGQARLSAEEASWQAFLVGGKAKNEDVPEIDEEFDLDDDADLDSDESLSWQEQAEARGQLRQTERTSVRQEFSQGEVVIDGDGYIVIDPEGNHRWVAKDEFLGNDNNRQSIEVKILANGNLGVIFPKTDIDKGEARVFIDDLARSRGAVAWEMREFEADGEHQWLGISLDGNSINSSWILVETRVDGGWVMTKDKLVPVEKMVSETSRLIPVGENGSTQFMLVGYVAPRDNTYDQISHLEILHPSFRQSQAVFNAQRTGILAEGGAADLGGRAFHFKDLPLDFVFQPTDTDSGWRFIAFREEVATEMPEMPRPPEKERAGFSAARIHNFLVEAGISAMDIPATLTFMMLFSSEITREPSAIVASFLLTGFNLVTSTYLGWKEGKRLIQTRETEKSWIKGMLFGIGFASTSEGLNQLVNYALKIDSPNLLKTLAIRPLFNVILPRMLPKLITRNSTDETRRENMQAALAGVRLGVIMGTSMGIIFNLVDQYIKSVEASLDHEVTAMPTHTQEPTQMTTSTPVTPGPGVPTVTQSATPSPIPSAIASPTHVIPTMETVMATATQMVGELDTFIQSFDFTPDKPYSNAEVRTFAEHFQSLMADVELKKEVLASGLVQEITTKNGGNYWLVDQNGDGVIDAILTNKIPAVYVSQDGENFQVMNRESMTLKLSDLQ